MSPEGKPTWWRVDTSVPISFLRSIFEYDEKTGDVFRLIDKRFSTVKRKRLMKCNRPDGYKEHFQHLEDKLALKDEITLLKSKLEGAVECLEILRVAVNDKQPDRPASSYLPSPSRIDGIAEVWGLRSPNAPNLNPACPPS